MWLLANVTREYSGELVHPTKSMWKGLRSRPHRLAANTDARLAYGQANARLTDWLTQKQSLKRHQAGIQRTAILTGWTAELQAAYLRVCHNLSRGKKRTWHQISQNKTLKQGKSAGEPRTLTKKRSWAGQREITIDKKTNKKKGCSRGHLLFNRSDLTASALWRTKCAGDTNNNTEIQTSGSNSSSNCEHRSVTS